MTEQDLRLVVTLAVSLPRDGASGDLQNLLIFQIHPTKLHNRNGSSLERLKFVPCNLEISSGVLTFGFCNKYYQDLDLNSRTPLPTYNHGRHAATASGAFWWVPEAAARLIQPRKSLFVPRYSQIIPDLQNNINSRQKLESQQQENKGVQKVGSLHLGAGAAWLKSVGICQSQRGCENLQIGWAGAAKAGQDGSSDGCWWETRVHWQGDVSLYIRVSFLKSNESSERG